MQVAAALRELGVQGDDATLARVAGGLFDPGFRYGEGEGAEQRAHVDIDPTSTLGHLLRVIAVLVGLCGQLAATVPERAPQLGNVDLSLVRLWRPLAQEGLS